MGTGIFLPLLCEAMIVFVAVFTLLRGSGLPAGEGGEAHGAGAAWTSLLGLLRQLPMVRAAQEASRQAAQRSCALRELPALLDVVTLGLASGLSFDASLELYCQRYRTNLAGAFSEAMLSWRLGIRGRGEALEELAKRLDVAALSRFAGAVTQALTFGSPLAEALEQQADAIRDEQRSELEAEIERVPVKMLIPLGTLIVPAMLLSILGPLLGSSLSFG